MTTIHGIRIASQHDNIFHGLSQVTFNQTAGTVLDTPTPTTYNDSESAGMAEMADAADLKSAGEILVGSSPSPGIIKGGQDASLADNFYRLSPRSLTDGLSRRASPEK